MYTYNTVKIETAQPAAAKSATKIPRKGIIAQLKARGFKMRVRHYRHVIRKDGAQAEFELFTRQNRDLFSYVSSLGGYTEVDVTFPDETTITGVAVCSAKDSYCRRLGAYLAFQRAVKQHKDTRSLL